MAARVLVMGAGMVGRAMALDLAERHEVTAADRDEAALAPLAAAGVRTRRVDAADAEALRDAAGGHDLAVCAVPSALGYGALRALIEAGVPVADISFLPEDALELDGLARDRGVAVAVDVGVAPGLDHMILGEHDRDMEVESFECLVGGLPRARSWPFEYKAPFSPGDVIEEYLRPARLQEHGRVVVRPALSDPELVEFPGVGTLEAFLTDGLRSLLRTMAHVPEMREKTMRYPGHRELMLALRTAGFLDDEPVDVGGGARIAPRALSSRLLFDAWRLEPGEPEMTLMRVTVRGREGGEAREHAYHLHDVTDARTGTTSMARTTGYTCTAVAELILSGALREPGVHPAERVGAVPGAFAAVRRHLEERGVALRHESS